MLVETRREFHGSVAIIVQFLTKNFISSFYLFPFFFFELILLIYVCLLKRGREHFVFYVHKGQNSDTLNKFYVASEMQQVFREKREKHKNTLMRA